MRDLYLSYKISYKRYLSEQRVRVPGKSRQSTKCMAETGSSDTFRERNRFETKHPGREAQRLASWTLKKKISGRSKREWGNEEEKAERMSVYWSAFKINDRCRVGSERQEEPTKANQVNDMRTGRATSNRSQGKAGHNLQISHSYLLWLMGPLVTLMKSCTYDILHSVSMGACTHWIQGPRLKKKKKKKSSCCSPWRRTENFRSKRPSVSEVLEQEVQQGGALEIHGETRGGAPAVTQSCSDGC